MLNDARRALAYAAIFLAVVYLADYLGARTNPLGSVQIQPYYAIHLKNKKIEFHFDVSPRMESCVQSLAPHLGHPPCWYLRRHATRRIDD